MNDDQYPIIGESLPVACGTGAWIYAASSTNVVMGYPQSFTSVAMPYRPFLASPILLPGYHKLAKPSPAQKRTRAMEQRAEATRRKNLPGWLMGHGGQGATRPHPFRPPGKCPLHVRLLTHTLMMVTA
jgi:hypothetical protein